MPFKGENGEDLPACDVKLVVREWAEDTNVRRVCVNKGRMFESASTPTNNEEPPVRINIRDCVRNMYALKPCLERMAKHDHHPVPYVKDLGRERLALALDLP